MARRCLFKRAGIMDILFPGTSKYRGNTEAEEASSSFNWFGKETSFKIKLRSSAEAAQTEGHRAKIVLC